MGLFEKVLGPLNLKDRRRASTTFKTLTAYQPTFTSWNGKIYESELVRSAINVRATHVSKLKVEIIGSAQPTLQTKLKKRPNKWQTWSQFLYRCSTILDVQNTLFLVPLLDPFTGSTVGIYPIMPSRVRLIDYDGEVWLEYKFNNGQTAVVEYAKCGVMTKFQYKDDFFGESNSALHDTMRLVDIQKKGIMEAVRNSASYRFMAKLQNFSRPEDIAKERKRFDEENFRDEGGGILLFPNTYNDIKQMENKNYVVDAEQMKLIQTNVFNYFGVNEDVLQNKAYGDKWNAFYESAVEPFAIQFSEVITNMLLSDREMAGTEIMLSSNRLQYLSNTEKLNVSNSLIDRGILNRDEVREMWNLPPLPDGSGQNYIIRAEYVDAADNGGNDNA